MVYHRTTQELNAAYANMVGRCDYVSAAHRPDGQTALQLAQLQPGQSVLEIGAGSGRFIAEAKQRVGNGICVAVDAVQGFLDVDIPWALKNSNLTVYPAGTPHQQVRLLQTNITDAGAEAAIRAVPGAPQGFDCIVALHVFHTLPADQRRPALIKLRRLLAPNGRLVVTMSARFTDNAAAAAEVATPVQFRTTGHTEAPGCSVLMQWTYPPRILTPRDDRLHPAKDVRLAVQLSPSRFWVEAATQVREAAMDAGFSVHTMRNVGKGDSFGFAIGPQSPPQSALDAKDEAQLGALSRAMPQPGHGACVARILETVGRRRSGQPNHPDHDYLLIEALQEFVQNEDAVIRHKQPTWLVAGETIEPMQVGVMVVLQKV